MSTSKEQLKRAFYLGFTNRQEVGANETDRLKQAFYLGFMCSREGFNGECTFEHLCDGLTPSDSDETERQFIERMGENSAVQSCLSEAIQKIKGGQQEEEMTSDSDLAYAIERLLVPFLESVSNVEVLASAPTEDNVIWSKPVAHFAESIAGDVYTAEAGLAFAKDSTFIYRPRENAILYGIESDGYLAIYDGKLYKLM